MSNPSTISKAFILGAGLGTRLRPLTNQLPKPLVPVWNAPLITYAFDHLIHDLGTSQFMVNTHHAAGKYAELFPELVYRDCSIDFRHETVLLDTAGGLDNIRDWLPDDSSFLVYNGDILTDLPLKPAVEQHDATGDLVTLVLRSGGANANVAFDADSGKVTDMRNALEADSENLFQFTGIYLVSPRFLPYLKPGKVESIVMPFLKAIQNERKIGGIVIDEGHWSDLGDVASYLNALELLAGGEFPAFGLHPNKCRIHSMAKISSGAKVDEISSIGAMSMIEDGASVNRSAVWPQAVVKTGQTIDREVVLPYA